MKRVWRDFFLVAIGLTFAAIASAADSGSTRKICAHAHSPKGSVAPVYLLHDAAGTEYTFSVAAAPNGGYVVTYHAVSQFEIDALCTGGVELWSMPDASAARNAKAHPKSGLAEPLPSSFSIVKRFGAVYGNLWIAGETPSGVTTQWTGFKVRTEGYNGTLQHIPVALFLDAGAMEQATPQIVGNGMLLGDVHFRTISDGGCGSAAWPDAPKYSAQVEAFWSGGNHIYGASCDPNGTFDDVTYDVVLEASTGGWVAYTKTAIGQSYQSPAIFTLGQRPSFDPSFGGILFASTGDGTVDDFTLTFTNATCS